MALNKPNKVIVHHTGGTDAQPLADTSKHTAEIVDVTHKTRWPGFTSAVFKNKAGEPYHVGYHFVIENTGKVVQCRAYGEEGAHCIGQNASSIGIVLSGNFDATLPTKKQEESFVKLFREIQKAYPNIKDTDIYPHRKFATKSCYGKNLTDNYFTVLLGGAAPQAVTAVPIITQIGMIKSQIAAIVARRRFSTKQKRNV